MSHPAWVSAAARAILLAMLALAPAAQAAVKLTPAAEPAAVTATGPDLKLAYTLSNPGSTPLTLTVRGGPFASSAGAALSDTVWRWADDNRVLKGEETVTLAAGASRVLSVTATAPAAGRYAARLVLTEQGGKPAEHLLAIERRSAQVPTQGVIVAPGAPLQEDRLWPWGRGTARLDVRLHNPQPGPLDLHPPMLAEVDRRSDDTLDRLSLDDADGTARDLSLGPGESARAVLPAPYEGPGAYTAKVVVGGPGGGEAAGDIAFNVRAAAFWALLVSTLGSICGWVVGGWSSGGRALSFVLEDLASDALTLRRVETLAPAARNQAFFETLQTDHAALHARAYDRKEQPTPEELASVRTRVRRALDWALLEQRFAETASPSQALTAARAAALAALNADAASDAAASALQAYRAAFQGAVARNRAGAMLEAAFIPFQRQASSGRIARTRRVMDVVVWALSTLLFALLAVQVVWLKSPAWGGWADLIGLFFTAFAAQGGAKVVFDQWSGVLKQPRA